MRNIIILSAFVIMSLYGCGRGTQIKTSEPEGLPETIKSGSFTSFRAKFGMNTVVHEGCEYVIYKDSNNSACQMIHKPKCKNH